MIGFDEINSPYSVFHQFEVQESRSMEVEVEEDLQGFELPNNSNIYMWSLCCVPLYVRVNLKQPLVSIIASGHVTLSVCPGVSVLCQGVLVSVCCDNTVP